MSETTGRRTQRRGFSVSPLLVIGVLLPLLTVGALLLVRPTEPTTATAAPTRTTLTNSVAVCPAAPDGGAGVWAAALGDPAGTDVTASPAGSDQASGVRLGAGASTSLGQPGGGLVVRAQGEDAGGVVAAESGQREVSVTGCGRPTPTQWYTGVGSGAAHTSTLQLTNPDEGPAVADVQVFVRTKLVEVPSLRGVTVRGGQTLDLDIGKLFPKRVDLTFGVTVSRGRLATSVLDTVPKLGTRRQTQEWLPSQPAPATTALLLGLPDRRAEDTLVLANPGDSETRAQVRIVTQDAAFSPQGLKEIRVPPQATSKVDLSAVLDRAVKDGALGIEVTAEAPVTAALRSIAAGDLSYAAPVTPTDQPLLTPVPARPASVVLGRATGAGVVTVTAWSDGQQVLTRRVAITEGSGGLVKLPRGTDLVRLDPQRASVAAALRLADKGTAVLPLVAPDQDALIPQVRPDLP